jgi:hypothetical protein
MSENLLRRMSRNHMRLNLSGGASQKVPLTDPEPLEVATARAAPKPLFASTGLGEKAMTREEKIAMLLEKAQPKNKKPASTSSAGDATTSKSERLERSSSYSTKSDGSVVGNNNNIDEFLKETQNGTRLERSTSFDGGKLSASSPSQPPRTPSPKSPRTPIASPRGANKEARNSYAGSSNRSVGTFTRIIYYRSVVLLGPPAIILVPNESVTDTMREALQRAHSAEFGVGVDKNGFNEAELKAPAIWLCEKDVSQRTKVLMSQHDRLPGDKGALAPYFQPTTPDPCIAATTITHEYIFKNSI